MPTRGENLGRSKDPVSQAIAWSQDLVAQTFRIWAEVCKPFVTARHTGVDQLAGELAAARAEANEATTRAREAEAARGRLQEELEKAAAARDVALSARATAERAKTQADAGQDKAQAERNKALEEKRAAEATATQARAEVEQARRALVEAQRETEAAKRREAPDTAEPSPKRVEARWVSALPSNRRGHGPAC